MITKIVKLLTIIYLITITIGCMMNHEPLFDGESCDTDCIIFTGKIIDPNNNVPVSSKINIYYKTSSYFGTQSTYIGQTVSDESGEYHFTFDGSRYAFDRGYFIIKAEKDGYLTNRFDGRIELNHIDSTNFDVPIVNDIKLIPSATLRINLKINNLDLIEHIDYYFLYDCTPVGYGIFKEDLVQDTILTHGIAGDQYTKFSYSYEKGNSKTVVNDSVYINAGETAIYEIEID